MSGRSTVVIVAEALAAAAVVCWTVVPESRGDTALEVRSPGHRALSKHNGQILVSVGGAGVSPTPFCS
jgi:hypothetical protein